jgi:hypothetical protein
MNSLSLSSIASRPPSPHAMEIVELMWKGVDIWEKYLILGGYFGCELLIYQKQ